MCLILFKKDTIDISDIIKDFFHNYIEIWISVSLTSMKFRSSVEFRIEYCGFVSGFEEY